MKEPERKNVNFTTHDRLSFESGDHNLEEKKIMSSDGVPCEFTEPKNDSDHISENENTNSLKATTTTDSKTAVA